MVVTCKLFGVRLGLALKLVFNQSCCGGVLFPRFMLADLLALCSIFSVWPSCDLLCIFYYYYLSLIERHHPTYIFSSESISLVIRYLFFIKNYLQFRLCSSNGLNSLQRLMRSGSAALIASFFLRHFPIIYTLSFSQRLASFVPAITPTRRFELSFI